MRLFSPLPRGGPLVSVTRSPAPRQVQHAQGGSPPRGPERGLAWRLTPAGNRVYTEDTGRCSPRYLYWNLRSWKEGAISTDTPPDGFVAARTAGSGCDSGRRDG